MKKLLPIIFLFLFTSINISYSLFIDTEAETAIIIDGDTGQILFEKNKDTKTYPASMTKIMTILIIFEKLKNGTLQLDDKFTVSERAWKEREGSSMFVEVGKEIRVEDLLRGIIIQSGNDACIVVSNHQGQWESFFIQTLFIPNTSIVKRELLLIPFFGWALRCMKPITLNRANKFSSLKKVIIKGVDRLKAGYSVILFPEGTRIPPEKGIQRFANSCGVLSIEWAQSNTLMS